MLQPKKDGREAGSEYKVYQVEVFRLADHPDFVS
jgi:hypothetical protein